MDTAIEHPKDVLQKKGLRPSFHRIKILEYLYQMRGHPTVDDIYSSLRLEIPSLSRATIYNTLDSFVEVGLIRVISIDGIEKRYDVTLYDHGHFKCERCGKIINFKVDLDQVFLEDLTDFEIHDRNIYFNGLCPDCLKTIE
jgi:Fe2+ or Zn2+ uptake regulation protein